MSVTLREKKLDDGTSSLYLDLYINGQRKYEFLKIYLGKDKEVNKENRRVAESIRAKREIEINNNQYGMIPTFKSNIDFVKYFEQKAGNDIYWKKVLYHLKNYTRGIKLSAVDEKWLKSFQDYLLTKVKVNSVHNYFIYINLALNKAVKEKLIPDNPCKYIDKLKMEEVEKVYLTIDEVQKLADAECPDPEVKRAFLFSCQTGLRIGDLRKLSYTDIEDGKLKFRQKKTGRFEYIPLSNTAERLIENRESNIIRINKSEIFELPNPETIRQNLKRWCKNAGINKPVTFHTSRHSFATIALTQGVDLYTVSKLLGHRSITTTQIYAKIVNEKMREAVNKLPEIDFDFKQA